MATTPAPRAQSGSVQRLAEKSSRTEIGRERLHYKLPQHLQKILCCKKLLLWKHILVSLGYGDAKIVDDIVEGFSVTGWAHATGCSTNMSEQPR